MLLLTFANSLKPDQSLQKTVVKWIQNVDNEQLFEKVGFKKICRQQKIMKPDKMLLQLDPPLD